MTPLALLRTSDIPNSWWWQVEWAPYYISSNGGMRGGSSTVHERDDGYKFQERPKTLLKKSYSFHDPLTPFPDLRDPIKWRLPSPMSTILHILKWRKERGSTGLIYERDDGCQFQERPKTPLKKSKSFNDPLTPTFDLRYPKMIKILSPMSTILHILKLRNERGFRSPIHERIDGYQFEERPETPLKKTISFHDPFPPTFDLLHPLKWRLPSRMSTELIFLQWRKEGVP